MSEEMVGPKAYDMKVLLEKMKSRGLDLAEDAGKIIVEEVFDWLTESAPLSKTPIDDILAVAYPAGKKIALEMVDKIDGQAG